MPSSNTFTFFPKYFSFASLEYLFTNSFNLYSLSSFSFVSISSFILLAGVPSLGEKINVNAESNLQIFTTSMVSSKSSLVSPGKPTIISVVIDAFGIVSFIFLNNFKYDSFVYLLPISFKILFDPDWSGRCIYGMIFSYLEIVSIISSVKSHG